MPNAIEKALDLTSIPPIRDWIKRYFALKTELPTNTSDLTNDGDGTDNNSPFITEAYLESELPTNTSDLVNDGDGTDNNSPFATQAYVTANGGKINKIKVNNVEQVIDTSDKSVNITVPTNVSDLTNDSEFQTEQEVQSAIAAAVTGAYKAKGSVATVADLPSTGNTVGDVYDVLSTGMNYVWADKGGTQQWDEMAPLVDTSTLWSKSELTFATVSEVEAILNAT